MDLAIRPSLFDARQPSRDPTGTAKLRAAFRADAKLRLRQWRAAMRVAVIDQDVLGLSQGTVMGFHPADVRLNAFHAWLDCMSRHYLHSRWPDTFIDRAWESGRQAAATEVYSGGDDPPHHPGPPQHLAQLAKQELQGISAATVQQVSRAAAGVLMRDLKAPKAWQVLAKAFDQVATNRLCAMCNVLTIAGHNQGKIATYRGAGLSRVGIIPETHDHAVLHDKSPREIIAAALKRTALRTKAEELLAGVATAGDARVCDVCDGVAEDSPYTLDEALSLLPVHPNCRCAVFAWKGETQDAAPAQRTVGPRASLYFADVKIKSRVA